MFYAHGYDKGSSLQRIEVWNRIKERTGKWAGKDKPELPESIEHLWQMYVEIKNGCERVGYVELDAYQRMMSIELNQWEVSLMIDLDIARRDD